MQELTPRKYQIYALYKRNRRILMFFITLCILEIVFMAILIGNAVRRLQSLLAPSISFICRRGTSDRLIYHTTGLPLQSTVAGCAYQSLLPFSSLFWILGLVNEPIAFALVAAAYRAWAPFRCKLRAPLIRQMDAFP